MKHANGKLDFAPSEDDRVLRKIVRRMDEAIAEDAKIRYEAGRGSGVGDVAYNRLGAGYIGHECGRYLAYRYHKAPKEKVESTVNPGELQRHAEFGHFTEEKMAEWLRLIGLELHTEKSDGSQYGWKNAHDPDTGQARLAGEIDGVITGAPHDIPLPLPCLWESKKATHKKATKFVKEGVRKADPKYYGQLQINMAHLDVETTLFTMLDLDNMKPHMELVTFDRGYAQNLIDRAVRVIQSQTPEEMPRLGVKEDDWRCSFCEFKGRCWTTRARAAAAGAPQVAPSWLSPKV